MKRIITVVLCTLLFATANFANATDDWSLWDTKNQHEMVKTIMEWSYTKSDIVDLKVKYRSFYNEIYDIAEKAFYGYRIGGPKRFEEANMDYITDLCVETMKGDDETFKNVMNTFSDPDNKDDFVGRLVENMYGKKYAWYVKKHPEMVEMSTHTAEHVFDLYQAVAYFISSALEAEEDIQPAKSDI